MWVHDTHSCPVLAKSFLQETMLVCDCTCNNGALVLCKVGVDIMLLASSFATIHV